jgi:DNA primase
MENSNPLPTIDELKSSIDLADYIRSCGIELTGNDMELKARCPFPDHEDKTPSFYVNTTKQLFNCFGCGRKGSVIDFIKEYENLTIAEALKKLSEQIQPINGKKIQIAKTISLVTCTPSPIPSEAAPLLADVAEYYHRALFSKDTRGLDYLKRRGIHDVEMLKHFKVGFVTGSLPRVLPKNRIDELKQCGILTDSSKKNTVCGCLEFFTGCVVVPLQNAQKQVVGFYGRSISGTKHLYLPGPHRGLVNVECAVVYDDIILAESVIDALSIYQAGRMNVIPCYGTNGFTPLHDELIGNAGKPVTIAFDNDDAGKTAADKLSVQLNQKGITTGIFRWPESVKDANEFFLYNKDVNGRRTLDDFDKLLKKVKWLKPETLCHSPKSERPVRRSSAGQQNVGGLNLIKHTGNELLYAAGKLFYKLRGLYLNGVTSLKLVVTVSKDEQIGPDSVTVTDRFDLYMAKSRRGFSHRVEDKLHVPASVVEDDLDHLIPKLEILREEHNKTDDPSTSSGPEMTDLEKKEALSFLKNPNLLNQITSDLETLGYAGEDTAKQLCYLIATSRKLTKPLSCIIRSESGAGKSYLMELIADLMPEEDVEYFSRLTPQSLYYMGRDRLVHKLLIVDERDGSEESEYPIRTLQTRRKLTLAVPRKDDKGNMTTTILEINGPIAYMESTTSDYLNPENANRCFEIFLDESQNQTIKIFSFQRQSKTMDGWKRERRKEHVIQRHQNAQRLLQPIKVIIPYAELIDFPVSWIRGRRDHERFLNLIEAIAFLHQYQRPCKKSDEGQEYLEATIDDYKIAYALAKTVFTHSLSELPQNASLLYQRIKDMVAENCNKHGIKPKDYWFKRRDLREYTKTPDHQIKRIVKLLVDLDYLSIRRAGYGGTHFYHLSNHLADFTDIMKGVTTPAQLEKKVTEAQMNKGTK